MKNFLIILGIVALITVVLVGSYNNLATLEEGVNSSWAQVENVYQRRMDLIPNLVETVKGYASHERETLESVIQARAKATQIALSPELINSPDKLAQFQQAQGELSSVLARLMAVSERYPDLKANQNFLTLQSQLEGTENRIAVERGRFNEAAQAYNTKLRVFPSVILARLFGFQPKAYFQAESGANKAPQVKFN